MPKEIENIRIPTKLQHPIPTEPHSSPLFPIKNERKKKLSNHLPPKTTFNFYDPLRNNKTDEIPTRGTTTRQDKTNTPIETGEKRQPIPQTNNHHLLRWVEEEGG